MTDAAGAVTVSAAELDHLCGLLGLAPPDALDIPARRDRAPALPGSAGTPPIMSALRRLGRAPLRPAPGRAVRIPVAVLTEAVAAAGDEADQLVVELMRRGMSGPGARSLVDANREVDAVFRIGVTVRGTDGPRHGPYRITVAHNASGHHCRRPSPGPPDALMTVPATAPRLALEIDELVRVTAERPVQRLGAGRGSTRPADAGGIGSGTGANTW